MVRQALKKNAGRQIDHFKLRGKDHTRIESLSDGVFAIAIALLLISSEIPETFDELVVFMYDFVAFGATITLLMLLWCSFEQQKRKLQHFRQTNQKQFLNLALLQKLRLFSS